MDINRLMIFWEPSEGEPYIFRDPAARSSRRWEVMPDHRALWDIQARSQLAAGENDWELAMKKNHVLPGRKVH